MRPTALSVQDFQRAAVAAHAALPHVREAERLRRPPQDGDTWIEDQPGPVRRIDLERQVLEAQWDPSWWAKHGANGRLAKTLEHLRTLGHKELLAAYLRNATARQDAERAQAAAERAARAARRAGLELDAEPESEPVNPVCAALEALDLVDDEGKAVGRR